MRPLFLFLIFRTHDVEIFDTPGLRLDSMLNNSNVHSLRNRDYRGMSNNQFQGPIICE